MAGALLLAGCDSNQVPEISIVSTSNGIPQLKVTTSQDKLEARGGKTPIYLMDDIFGELDPQRRNALMSHLPPNAQKWITTTHLDWLKETPELEGIRRFKVSGGACA